MKRVAIDVFTSVVLLLRGHRFTSVRFCYGAPDIDGAHCDRIAGLWVLVVLFVGD